MANLRINSVVVENNKTINATFTEQLILNINETNIKIVSSDDNIPDATPIHVSVSGNSLRIECTPLHQFGSYDVVFISTNEIPFMSFHGEFRLSNDGISNKASIMGPMPDTNPVKQFLQSYYNGNIYDTADTEGLVYKHIDGVSNILSKALYDIGQVKNENYISQVIFDEKKTRGAGPTDRLNEESAYELIRVGRTPTSSKTEKLLEYDVFPYYPITLQGISNTENLEVGIVNEIGIFNKIDFILNLQKNPVVKLTSLTFIMDNSDQIYIYNIEEFGYQILSSRYDQDFAFDYYSIDNNQIKLSNKLLEDEKFIINDILDVLISYEYKNLGIVPDNTSVEVYTINKQIREVLPPIINVFNFKNNNLVDEFGKTITIDGVSFQDPNSNNINSLHPSFKYEIEFKLNSLPSIPGQYSIDYKTGTVYVYGSDISNDGTGPYPPLATYYYKYTYINEQDYVYDDSLLDLVSLPTGLLRGFSGKINFKYEEVFTPGVDYNSSLHVEILNERINNSLLSLNTIKSSKSPITNVFRVYNETSGEIYGVERWLDNKIYIKYNKSPNIIQLKYERVSFKNITNELLFVDSAYLNSNFIKIYKISLKYNEIISSSEDGIGYFLNTSLFLSNNNIFISEKWFNYKSLTNISVDNIENVGEYVVDYKNGIIYVGVDSDQDNNIGEASYKTNDVLLTNKHIISVDNIYYQTNPLSEISTTFDYVSFADDSVIVANLDNLDEFNKNKSTEIYFVNDQLVGIEVATEFFPGVTYKIKDVRGIFEYTDVQNDTNPINFSNYSTHTDFDITINKIEKSTYSNVIYDGYDFYILLDESFKYISSNIDYIYSVKRQSNNDQLWDNSGVVVVGNQLKLILSGVNTPVEGETVFVEYSFEIINSSNVIVDYNKGELYIDYTYLADEISISYEYGDNVIDFRTSTTISEGEEYFVSYRSGALRDSLLKNFGTLLNVPELLNFDIDFNRERYRDAVFAGLSSFVQGPTVNAIKNIGNVISHIQPIITESIFGGWSLGNSLLSTSDIEVSGNPNLVEGKFGNGLMINENDQTITLPFNSNFRLEEGTFESWIQPNWNGIDNDASLTFEITKDGYTVLGSEVFIGLSELHPIILDGKFTISKPADFGTPNLNKDGIFIYYDLDQSTLFYKWHFRIIDGYSSAVSNYLIKINSSGNFYNFKSADSHTDSTIFSSVNYVNIKINPITSKIDRDFSFISDTEKYLLDFGESSIKNRISILKDVSGYIIFRAYDFLSRQYVISYDVSKWQALEKHFISVSWKLNSINNRDELHLFIDGFEVPNIYKYNQKHSPYLHEKFRIVSAEEIIGISDLDIVGSDDLHTTINSNVVSSTLNFSSYNISVGDVISIDEVWFNSSGYTILSISGQQLTLSDVMPITLTDAKFIINKSTFTTKSYVDTSTNIVVSRIPVFFTGNDLSGTISEDTVISATNFVANNILPGYSLRINDGYSTYAYPIINVDTNELLIDGYLPITFSGVDFWIYGTDEIEIPGKRARNPSYYVGKDENRNDIITFINNVFAYDLLIIKTLGLNSENVNARYYIWSNNIENIIRTTLPTPIYLDDVIINKVILNKTLVDSNNSTLVLNVYQSNHLLTDQPSNSELGRTLTANISGLNVDFSTPVSITINGVSNTLTVSETLMFSDFDNQDFSNLYTSVNYVQINAKPINVNRPAITVEIKEKYEITKSENDGLVPEIKYSYYMGSGSKLFTSDGYLLTDNYNTFSYKDVGNYLLIHAQTYDIDGYSTQTPGFYLITDVLDDLHTLEIQSTDTSVLPLNSFTDGYYTVLNTTDYRSGLQNGFFTFEISGKPSTPYLLSKGYYDFKYQTYSSIKINPFIGKAFIGSDFNTNKQINGVIDQVKVYSSKLTDTRIGEVIPTTQRSITKDFYSLKELKKNTNTLSLINFNELPLVNIADKYTYKNNYKNIFYSSEVINSNFGNSISISNKPIKLLNDGILDTSKESTIEFWANPNYDTNNDPNIRYYFDASSVQVEEFISENNSTININNPVSKVISVKLSSEINNINYFDGGKLEVNSDRTIREEMVSTGNSIVILSKKALQISTVKILNDFTNTDYYANGSIDADNLTVYLGKALPQSNIPLVITYLPIENQNDVLNKQVIRLNRKLPKQNTKVIVTYQPKGTYGNRISIFKDKFGYINFSILSKDKEFVISAPTTWVNGTWHRIKASFIANSSTNKDEMRLFVDGYEYNNVLYGEDIVVNDYPLVMGASRVGESRQIIGGIKLKDPINNIFIGSAYDSTGLLFGLIDNLRISNVSRPIYKPFGESIDVNYSSNIDSVLPVTEDLYTTFLLNLNENRYLVDDYAVLKDRTTGLFNFLVEIIDSYGIIDRNIKSKEALEKLINVLKPANSRAFIKYIS